MGVRYLRYAETCWLAVGVVVTTQGVTLLVATTGPGTLACHQGFSGVLVGEGDRWMAGAELGGAARRDSKVVFIDDDRSHVCSARATKRVRGELSAQFVNHILRQGPTKCSEMVVGRTPEDRQAGIRRLQELPGGPPQVDGHDVDITVTQMTWLGTIQHHTATWAAERTHRAQRFSKKCTRCRAAGVVAGTERMAVVIGVAVAIQPALTYAACVTSLESTALRSISARWAVEAARFVGVRRQTIPPEIFAAFTGTCPVPVRVRSDAVRLVSHTFSKPQSSRCLLRRALAAAGVRSPWLAHLAEAVVAMRIRGVAQCTEDDVVGVLQDTVAAHQRQRQRTRHGQPRWSRLLRNAEMEMRRRWVHKELRSAKHRGTREHVVIADALLWAGLQHPGTSLYFRVDGTAADEAVVVRFFLGECRRLTCGMGKAGADVRDQAKGVRPAGVDVDEAYGEYAEPHKCRVCRGTPHTACQLLWEHPASAAGCPATSTARCDLHDKARYWWRRLHGARQQLGVARVGDAVNTPYSELRPAQRLAWMCGLWPAASGTQPIAVEQAPKPSRTKRPRRHKRKPQHRKLGHQHVAAVEAMMRDMAERMRRVYSVVDR